MTTGSASSCAPAVPSSGPRTRGCRPGAGAGWRDCAGTRHDIRRKTRESRRFRHPLVGEPTLDYESLTANSAPGQQLVVYRADPRSPSEQALSLLGSLAADPAHPDEAADKDAHT
ncbi:hypothetical protein ACFZCU_37045 [Streptomyces canus]|uniref:MmyB family transcriptional regulator n=1 Tax=Streptomyces canus TaxID=58343 RepID=UPI0036EA6015